jgi:hypothetical protein
MMKKQTSSKSYVMKFLAISIIMCILLLAGCNSKVSEENAKSNVVGNDETIHSLIGMVYGDQEIGLEKAESQDSDSDLRRLVVEDRSGKLSDLTISKKKVAPDMEERYFDLIAKFSVNERAEVVDVEPIVSFISPRNTYRLLNLQKDKVELGYKLDGDVRNSDFGLDERVWVDVSKDIYIFNDMTLKELVGKSIGIRLNDKNEIDFVAYRFDWTPITYDFKSPLDRNGISKSSLIMTVEDLERDKSDDRFDIRNLGVDETTNCYTYAYDMSLKKFIAEDGDLLGDIENLEEKMDGELDDVDEFSEAKIKYLNRPQAHNEKQRVHYICYDYGVLDRDHVRDVVEIIPSDDSILNLELSNDKVVVENRKSIDLSEDARIFDIESRGGDTVEEFISEHDENLKGWMVFDSNQKVKYIFAVESEILYFDDEINSKKAALINQKSISEKFEATIRDLEKDENGELFLRVNSDYWHEDEIYLKENQDPEVLFEKWQSGDEFMVYRFETTNPFGIKNDEKNYLKSAMPIKSLDSDVIYRYLGRLNGKAVFGFGGEIGDSDFDIAHSFVLESAEIKDPYLFENLMKLGGNERSVEELYIASHKNESGDIEYIIKPYFVEELENASMATKPLVNEILEGNYRDTEVEVLAVMNPESSDEFGNVKLRLKTKDGKEYEVGSKSDNWKDYQNGQNIKVRFELKDGEPVNICWAEGVK